LIDYEQCYDKYMMEKLRKAAEVQRHPEWGMGPSNAGSCNSRPQETEFFKDGGDYCSPYGKFFLCWYSQTLIEHGDSVLKMANLALKDVKISAKVRERLPSRNRLAQLLLGDFLCWQNGPVCAAEELKHLKLHNNCTRLELQLDNGWFLIVTVATEHLFFTAAGSRDSLVV
jgi:hypothetical protein